jgi:hypothetical protein
MKTSTPKLTKAQAKKGVRKGTRKDTKEGANRKCAKETQFREHKCIVLRRVSLTTQRVEGKPQLSEVGQLADARWDLAYCTLADRTPADYGSGRKPERICGV